MNRYVGSPVFAAHPYHTIGAHLVRPKPASWASNAWKAALTYSIKAKDSHPSHSQSVHLHDKRCGSCPSIVVIHDAVSTPRYTLPNGHLPLVGRAFARAYSRSGRVVPWLKIWRSVPLIAATEQVISLVLSHRGNALTAARLHAHGLTGVRSNVSKITLRPVSFHSILDIHTLS